MPTAGDQSLERTARGGIGIEVKGLRIEGVREAQALIFCERVSAGFEGVTDVEIFQIATHAAGGLRVRCEADLPMPFVFALLFGFAQVTPPPPPPTLVSPAPVSSATASPAPSASPVATPSAPAVPALIASPASLDLHPAQQGLITVTNATGDLSASLDHALAGISIDQTARTVTLTATGQTGSDVLHLLDASGARVDVPIRVAFDAGTVAPQATLAITGSPVDPAWLAARVMSLVTRVDAALPGATVTVTPPAAMSSPPPPGQQSVIDVPVAIAGGSAYYSVSGTTQVQVSNVAVAPFSPPLLFYDDDPERVQADGVLFRGTIASSQPVRLYYYHDDGAEPRHLAILLTPASEDPTQVQAIDSAAGPNLDVMSVGHATTRNFLLQEPANEGTVINLTGDTYVLRDMAMQPGQGVAGTLDLRVLTGGAVSLAVVAYSPGVDPLGLLSAPTLGDDGHHRTGIFTLAGYGDDALTFTVGGPDATVVYGDRQPSVPSVDPASQGHDYGDYGVLHAATFALVNPTAAPATVYLFEKPIGGIVRSSFLVDGSEVEMGCVRPPLPYQIGAYQLGPGQTYRLILETMADGGSNYPLEVGITQTPPQPTTPPISAPDGCFPKPLMKL